MLHVGRPSSAGPAHGAPCLRSPKQPYCASSCVYLWRMLKKTHPLFLRTQLGFGPFGSPQTLYRRVGLLICPSFATEKLSLARSFVNEADNEGKGEEDTCGIPADLPWAVNPSTAVHCWGTIYQGPLEAKYLNVVKDFPYPVGYTCIKTYKEKDYCQYIEEGSGGPVFTVREAGLGVLQANSPQKVWNKICAGDRTRVNGMRHFGFESSEVKRVLQAMFSCAKRDVPKRNGLRKSDRMDVDTSVKLASLKLSAEEVHSENLLTNAKVEETDNEEEHVGIKAVSADVEEDINNLEDEDEDEDDDDVYDIESGNDGRFAEGNASMQTRNDNDEDDDVLSDSEDDENGFVGGEDRGEVEEHRKAKDHLLSPHVYSDGRMSPGDIPRKAAGPSTGYKRTFKSGPHKVTFTRLSGGTDDMVKRDFKREESKDESQLTNNLVSHTPYAPRQKVLPTAERQVWRKGEGLTGYIPRQQAPAKVRIDEQGEGLTSIVPGNGRQQAAERIRQGEQGEGLIHSVRSLDKQQAIERMRIDDSRASGSLNYSTPVKPWEGSATKNKEDDPKSSHMLLELLNKWNKFKKGDPDTEDGMQRSLNERNIEEKAPLISIIGSAGHAYKLNTKDDESVLDELCNSEMVDESANFAVRKLFETGRKIFWDDGNSQPRQGKLRFNDPRGRVGAESVDTDQSVLDADSLNGLQNLVQDGVVLTKLTEAKNTMVSLAGANEARHEARSTAKSPVDMGEIEVRHEPSHMRHEPSYVKKRVSEAGKGQARQEPSGIEKPSVEPPEEVHVTKQAAEKIQLIEEVRKCIGKKRFEDAFKKVKAMRSSGMTVEEDVYEALMGLTLDPWQKEALAQVNAGYSVLVSAPSGAGKSVIADCCLYSNVINDQRALFVTPYEELATQSLHKFENMLGQSNVGGMQTRMRTQKGPKLVVVTLQMLSRILHEVKGPGGSEFRFFFEGVNMLVLDKFCTFGGANYGRLWEEIFMLMDVKIQVIALTLPAKNEVEIAAWISMNRGPCKLVSCKSEPVQKRYLFNNKERLYPLLDAGGLQVNNRLLEAQKDCDNHMTRGHLESCLWSGYDKPSLTKLLNILDVNAMLPALVVFLDAKSCDIALQDNLSNGMDGLLARSDIDRVELLFNEYWQKYPDPWNHLDKADREALCKGIAVFHEGKLPLWQDFVIKLFEENLVKVIVGTESSLLHTELMARTIILPAICKVTNNNVSLIEQGQFLQLIGRAGRRGHDIEGSVVFLDGIHSGPQEVASLVLDNPFSFSSCFKPSYSLVANLMAKHKVAEVKKILGRSFADFQFFTKRAKAKKMEELDREIFTCLETKFKLDAKLFEGLAQVNKHKLANAAMFTRVDIRLTIHLVSHSGNALPGILLATVPIKGESFYMVFGADNNFRLLPAGAFDHVYGTEVSPLDVVYKHATGRVLQPPLVPPKENWSVDEVGLFGYVASGDSRTKEYVTLMMQYPVRSHFSRDCLHLRKDIIALEAQASNLVDKRKTYESKAPSLESKSLESEATEWLLEEGDTWKAAVRLVNILQEVDALSIVDNQGAYVKLKPLGMLIARLPNVENELWLAMAVTSKYVKLLAVPEFTGVMATMIPLEAEVEGLCSNQREPSYRVTKTLKETFAGLEVLRKQIAVLQGSYSPPLQFDTAFAGLVYAWSRGKPGAHGSALISPTDGDMAWRLRSIARLLNSVYRACSQVSVDISEPNDFNNLSSLARRAEEMVSKQLSAEDRTWYS